MFGGNALSREINPMRSTRVILVIVAVLVIAGAAFYFFSNPLRKSDADLRAWLLTATPLGSSQATVSTTLDQLGWNDPRYQQTWPSPATKPFLGGELGGYQGFPWYVTVRAFWEFDDNNRLQNIRIHRVHDSP
jgi:hypothetical protein